MCTPAGHVGLGAISKHILAREDTARATLWQLVTSFVLRKPTYQMHETDRWTRPATIVDFDQISPDPRSLQVSACENRCGNVRQ